MRNQFFFSQNEGLEKNIVVIVISITIHYEAHVASRVHAEMAYCEQSAADIMAEIRGAVRATTASAFRLPNATRVAREAGYNGGCQVCIEFLSLCIFIPRSLIFGSNSA